MSELGQKQTFEKRTATSAPFQFRITAGMAQGRSAGEIHSASGAAPFEGLAQQNTPAGARQPRAATSGDDRTDTVASSRERRRIGVRAIDASPQPTQLRFTIGHSLLLRGRAASSAATVASSLR
jgi:hypothetical protein